MHLLLTAGIALVSRYRSAVLFIWLPLGLLTDTFLMLPLGTCWTITATFGILINVAH